MATKIIDNRQKPSKCFDELDEGQTFFYQNGTFLRMKIYDIIDDNGDVIANTVDLSDGATNYTPISDQVIPVDVTITIE